MAYLITERGTSSGVHPSINSYISHDISDIKTYGYIYIYIYTHIHILYIATGSNTQQVFKGPVGRCKATNPLLSH